MLLNISDCVNNVCSQSHVLSRELGKKMLVKCLLLIQIVKKHNFKHFPILNLYNGNNVGQAEAIFVKHGHA